MMPLKLEYEPCLRCMDDSEQGRPRARRCRHRADCAAHHVQNLPECRMPSDECSPQCHFFSHPRTCDCKEFTNPSLTITKIGAALHIEFPDHTVIDCDINVPTIPISTPYDGRVQEVKHYLSESQPVGWTEECSKLVDMGTAYPTAYEDECWQVKMRMFNRDMVLPIQVTGISF